MSSPDELLLGSLDRFYSVPGRLDVVRDVLDPKRAARGSPASESPDAKASVSLRVLDWLVTNYAKKHNIVYEVDGRMFNMYCAYKEQLKSFSKKYFDPFRRGPHIAYPLAGSVVSDDVLVVTTVGQLNFFRWAIRYGVIDFCARHRVEIERDMMDATRVRRVCESSKRHELSQAKTKQCLKTIGRVTMRFE